jgi:hypothetical protein
MPNAEAHTPRHAIRVDDDLWDRFGVAAGRDRSAVLREFMRWYLRESKARLPKRPTE